MPHQDAYDQIFLQNRFLLENIQGGIVYSDFEPPFHLRYVTEGMAHLSGYSQEELLGMVQMDLVYDEDIEPLMTDVGRQLGEGDTFTVEYRLKRKDGSLTCVLDRAKVVAHENGHKYIHCLLTDVTELKQMGEALRLSEEKYKIAIQQSGNAILEYEPLSGALKISDNYAQLFGGPPPSGSLRDVMRSSWIMPPSGTRVKALFEAAARDKASARTEVQICNGEGRYVWSGLHLTPVVNPFGSVYAVVGCLESIDERKRRLEALTDLSQKDGLTGIYNRATIEELINQHLCGSRPPEGALIILDLDYFKQVNDAYGHDVGDELLVALTRTVRKCLPKDALFGRLGGDEFLIFIPWPKDHAWLAEQGQGIVENVRTTFQNSKTPITVSLGMSCCDGTCSSFKNLYKKADRALYYVKRNGRNAYQIFEPSLVVPEERRNSGV